MFARLRLHSTWIVACALLFGLLWAGAGLSRADQETGKLRGDLPRVLAEAAADELIPVSIVLSDQLTGNRLRNLAAGVADRAVRRRILGNALKAHAKRTQAGLRAALQAARLDGRAEAIRSLWIGNIVAAHLTPDLVREVAARPEVDHVNWAPKVSVFLGPPVSLALPRSTSSTGRSLLGGDDPSVTEIECGVDLMQAPRVWNELGNTGEGAVIALIDTGVCWYHPDIENQIWVNPGEDLDGDGVVMDEDDMNGVDDDGNGYVDDLIGYDIDQRDSDPNDDNGHGSHTAGTIAGDGTSGTQAGMAPDAKVMVLRVGVTFADEPDVWEAMQYAADNGADSISMSLGWPHDQNPDRPTWRTNCENTIDMGTAMVIAAGNEGSGNEPDNVRTPGDVPRVITVGATDCSDVAAGFSSRGPVTWQDVPPWNDYPYPPGLVKPDVAAPGVSTKSHNFCSGYSLKSGTSMATPHVAGTVALMMSANPGLTHDDLKLILEDTAVDLGEPGKDNTYGSGRVDAYEAVLRSQSSDGIMSIKEVELACTDVAHLVVSDQDLRGAGTVDVDVTSETEPDAEVVTLTETSATSGVFTGEIPTDPGDPTPDGKIQVRDGDTVTATYMDADDGNGHQNVPKTDTAAVDCRPPVISNVRDTDNTDTTVVIRWDTDEPGDSRVDYGEQVPPDRQASDPARVTSHAVTLNGLNECTVYYYDVASADSFGNEATDDNGGKYYHFETWGDFGQGLQPCHAGKVTLEQAVAACNDTLSIRLVDIDLNLSANDPDTATVEVTSSTETTPEVVTLTETGPNTSTFTGTVDTSSGPVVEGDGVVQTSPGDVLTASYHDADDGTGSPAVSFDTADADCTGADATLIRVTNVTDESAQILVTTSEPTTVTVDWGDTPALGSQVSDTALASSHTLTVEPLVECGRFYFRVSTTDAYGNGSAFDAAGAPYEFNASTIPGAVFRDGFESDLGWTLEGEWELGAPQGLGTSPGDPTAAYSGTGVLGHDLSGQGAHPGDYEPGTTENATSPVIDASTLSNAELKFRRWLNVGGGGISSVEVKDTGGMWVSVWDSDSALGQEESSWSLETYDISAYADGNANLQIRFKQRGGFQDTAARAGWNVDRFIVRDGSLPDFDVCGGCGGTPSFAGVTSATDADACADTGVTLAWDEAAAWGTGHAGSYAVYRDTTPGFEPAAGNLVASGIAGTSWTDSSAPNDVTLYYVVRAENDETCAGGPTNGGTVDGNHVYAEARDETTQPLPGGLGDTLRADPLNDAHVRLSWQAVADAVTYHVYRADVPQGPFDRIGDTAETHYDDLDQMASGQSRYYKVVAADACGNEGP